MFEVIVPIAFVLSATIAAWSFGGPLIGIPVTLFFVWGIWGDH